MTFAFANALPGNEGSGTALSPTSAGRSLNISAPVWKGHSAQSQRWSALSVRRHHAGPDTSNREGCPANTAICLKSLSAPQLRFDISSRCSMSNRTARPPNSREYGFEAFVFCACSITDNSPRVLPSGKAGEVQTRAMSAPRAASCRRRHQPDHRQGAGPGRASVPRAQAPVRVFEDPLPRPGEEPRATVRTRQPVPRGPKADDMRPTLPKISGRAPLDGLFRRSKRIIAPCPHDQSPIAPKPMP